MGQLIKLLAKSIKFDGFKKENQIWRKNIGILTQIIEIQSSKYNSEVRESFTINIGIFSAKVHEMTWVKDVPVKPKEIDCIFRKRVSYFLDNQGDKWWMLQNEQDVEMLIPEIIGIFEKSIQPFFSKIDNYDSLYLILKDLDDADANYPLFKIQLACLSILIGKQSNGTAMLEDVKKDPVWGENAVKVLNNLGLPS